MWSFRPALQSWWENFFPYWIYLKFILFTCEFVLPSRNLQHTKKSSGLMPLPNLQQELSRYFNIKCTHQRKWKIRINVRTVFNLCFNGFNQFSLYILKKTKNVCEIRNRRKYWHEKTRQRRKGYITSQFKSKFYLACHTHTGFCHPRKRSKGRWVKNLFRSGSSHFLSSEAFN